MKTKLILSFLVCFSITSSCYAIQQNIKTATLVNHFSKKIKFTVSHNPQVVADLPNHFTLNKGDWITTRIAPATPELIEAYIVGDNGNIFFGIDAKQIHGYIGLGIAYSWQNRSDSVIVFCTPEEYQQKGHC